MRSDLAATALSKLDGLDLAEAELLRSIFSLEHGATNGDAAGIEKYRKLALKAVAAR